MSQPYQVMPPLAEAEYEALKASIAAGYDPARPIVVDENGAVLDGHHRHRRETTMTAVTGWRTWDISGDGTLWSPLNYGPDVAWPPGPLAAQCYAPAGREKHPIPDPSCSCGWRLLTTLDALTEGLMTVRDASGTTRAIPLAELDRQESGSPTMFIPKVIGLAASGGRTCDRDSYGDPDGTVRAQYAAVTGPLYLGQPFQRAAAAIADTYGADVILADVLQTAWIKGLVTGSGGLAADMKLYAADPAQLGGRLYRPNRASRRRGAALMRKMPG